MVLIVFEVSLIVTQLQFVVLLVSDAAIVESIVNYHFVDFAVAAAVVESADLVELLVAVELSVVFVVVIVVGEKFVARVDVAAAAARSRHVRVAAESTEQPVQAQVQPVVTAAV